ncbi:hypothetical protein PybrP1_010634 [[Pythium] brassicae (nom. inval.)]|nr:hypothetical protein PybrP1_010634 [[Pythium] brassicae (nom. inval.)]
MLVHQHQCVARPGAREQQHEDDDNDDERPHSSARSFAGSRDALWGVSRQLRLHSFDQQSRGAASYVETKIGGHALDHRRFVSADWRPALSSRALTLSPTAAALLSGRASPAFEAAKHHVLVYAATKIGGHALDHVPFIDRGQPSRPLLGYVPSAVRAALEGGGGRHSLPLPARIGRQLANLYDCSRCLRVRQSPRVQLSCGHPVCSACVSSRSMVHAEAGGFCFLGCAQCHALVAIEAVVFSSQYAVRINAPEVRTLGEFTQNTSASSASLLPSARAHRPASGWKYGGVVAALAMATKLLHPRSRRSGELPSDDADVAGVALLDDVAALAAPHAADASTTAAPPPADALADGAARWQKRVAGLQPPSPLLKYAFVRTLGVGNFAEVMLVQRRGAAGSDSGGLLSVLKESDKLQEAVNEIQLLSKIRSPHVVRIFRYWIEEVGHRHFAYIDMEYCDRGDLLQLLRQTGPLDGAAFDSDGVVKIADFGVSTWLESDVLTHHAAGTVAFMAPEVRRYFLGEAVSYDGRADIWSLGALAVAMLTGDPEPRVATRPLDELLEDLCERGVAPARVKLVQRALQPAPSDRASVAELLQSIPPTTSKL